jgi:hypothetical protein
MAKVKILFVASNPLEQSRLTLDEEIRAITAQIRSADYRDALELVSGWAVRPDDLQQLLLQHKPQIVHFSGHGTLKLASRVTAQNILPSAPDMDVNIVGRVGQLELTGEDGQVHPTSKAALLNLFNVLSDRVRLVLLNACHSEGIAETLAEVIPCTIGMNGEISDDAAIAFSTAFYRGLGFGRNLQEAFDLGKNALLNLQTPEDHAPRLFTRNGSVAPTKVVLVGPSIDTTHHVDAAADRNRRAMIEKVRAIWITGFLQQSLFHEVRILLGLRERPDAVARPMDLLVMRSDEGERPLTSGTQIVDVFDTMDRSMLILGAPGSGKTTLLLELTRDLLDRATKDPTHPIPIVFPLSTWAESRKPLSEWLVDELSLRYLVRRKIGREWIESDLVLPLLDGLDEVKPERRTACAEAINMFRQSHGLSPIVVCCRTDEFRDLSLRLRLQSAVVMQPVSARQIDSYLTEIGPDGAAVRGAFEHDPMLRELLELPLMLNIVIGAFAGQTELLSQPNATLKERRDRLFDAYVERMFRRRSAASRYSQRRSIQWLSWLAGQMVQHGQTVFYIEHLQPDWLLRNQQRVFALAYRLVTALVFALVAGLVDGLVVGLILALTGPATGLIKEAGIAPVGGLALVLLEGLNGAAVGAIVGGLASGTPGEIVCAERVRWSFSKISPREVLVGLARRTRIGVGAGLVVGFLLGFVGGLILISPMGVSSFYRSGEHIEMRAGLRMDLVARNAGLTGLAGGLIGVVTGLLIGVRRGTKSGLRSGVGVGLGLGLIGGAVSGLVLGLLSGLVGGPFWGLGDLLVVGVATVLCGALLLALIAGVIMALVGGVTGGAIGGLQLLLTRGLTVGAIETRDAPNQGIHRSARNALVVGLITGAVSGIVLWLAAWLIAEKGFGFTAGVGGIGLVGGLVVGLLVALSAGGRATLEHFVLRLMLVRNRLIPWNYAQFLDCAADRILLRKVGGGYMFIHRMLLEWFAERYVEAGPTEETPSTPR